jgi:hypothetical protein
MRLSPRVVNVTVATLVYFVVSALVVEPVEPLALLYRVAVFAAALTAVLWATNSESVVQSLRWFSAHQVTASYLFAFTLIMAAWLLFRGAGIARVFLETIHAFCFFWACAAIGELHFSRRR